MPNSFVIGLGRPETNYTMKRAFDEGWGAVIAKTEPPDFGKRTIFISRPSGGQEQWIQCDDCSQWAKLFVEVFLPPKWTCSDIAWDSSRASRYGVGSLALVMAPLTSQGNWKGCYWCYRYCSSYHRWLIHRSGFVKSIILIYTNNVDVLANKKIVQTPTDPEE
ncbi:hypothetical protein FNV43_RR04382 [Rhamnella rubrinervis]|uniref:CW-type domain-containing protein n=1 Tax=Rhamnella rubrinervis TaxID=2594499 RepID=A0A8K0HK49_9ROSA|nr:hypothetical protein FNV43_RR04382 [Rhamnella rubrinervis]